MKKLLMAIIILFVMFAAGQVFADWQITAGWTASDSQYLDHEDLIVGSMVVYTVPKGGQTSYVFTRTTLNGEVVKVISYNTQGVGNAGYTLGTLIQMEVPSLATGGNLTIIQTP